MPAVQLSGPAKTPDGAFQSTRPKELTRGTYRECARLTIRVGGGARVVGGLDVGARPAGGCRVRSRSRVSRTRLASGSASGSAQLVSPGVPRARASRWRASAASERALTSIASVSPAFTEAMSASERVTAPLRSSDSAWLARARAPRRAPTRGRSPLRRRAAHHSRRAPRRSRRRPGSSARRRSPRGGRRRRRERPSQASALKIGSSITTPVPTFPIAAG